MGRVPLVLLLLLMPTLGFADCWQQVTPGQASQELQCLLQNWKASPDPQRLAALFDRLFYVYLTDGNSRPMKEFFDGMRKGEAPFTEALKTRQELVARYTFPDSIIGDGSAIWAMQPLHARALFLFSQTDHQMPRDIVLASYLAVYDRIRWLFVLDSARRGEFRILPAREYLRLLEVLQRMDWVDDPYLRAVNRYYQGVVDLNLGWVLPALRQFAAARDLLEDLLLAAREKLPEKRILGSIADIDLVLGDREEAESIFLSILKIDPQDYGALLDLSYLLNQQGECSEPGVWVEAYIKTGQEFFDIVIHCGTREIPEQELEPATPVIAYLPLDTRKGAPASGRH